MQRQPLVASQRARIAAGLPFVESLARRLPGELSDLVADVFAEDGFDSAGDDLELIDLSSVESGSELHA